MELLQPAPIRRSILLLLLAILGLSGPRSARGAGASPSAAASPAAPLAPANWILGQAIKETGEAGPCAPAIEADRIARADKLRQTGRYAEAIALYRLGCRDLPSVDRGTDKSLNWNLVRAGRTGLALALQGVGDRQAAFSEMHMLLSVEQEALTDHFEGHIGFSEPELRLYTAQARSSLDLLVSFALDDLAWAARRTAPASGDDRFIGSVQQATLNWTLLRKGIVLDTMENVRGTLRPDPAQAAQIRDVRQRLTELELRPPPGADAARIAQLRRSLEDQLSGLELLAWNGMPQYGRARSTSPPLQIGDMYRWDGEPEEDRARDYVRLPEESALVEFLRAPITDLYGGTAQSATQHYIAFVLRADANHRPRMFDLGEAAEIEARVRDVLAAMTSFASEQAQHSPTAAEKRRAEADFRERSGRLYGRIFAPLRGALGGVNLLYVSPDGELNRIAFEALADPQSARQPGYLVQQFRFVYAPSGREIVQPEFHPGSGTVIFADPDFDLSNRARALLASRVRGVPAHEMPHLSLGGFARMVATYRPWPDLPFTENEAQSIAQMLNATPYGPVRIYRRDDAIAERLFTLHTPRILHLATHGFFFPDRPAEAGERSSTAADGRDDPLLRSGILLAGANSLGKEPASGAASGWVTAEEIMGLNLTGTELVVLSGCDTGLGDVVSGEGVYGLRRAFLYAGARTLLISLHEVPDQETASLMDRFYRSLKVGRGKLAALHDAELAMMAAQIAVTGVAHPYYWAGFVLVGDPN